jgi:hypothetical protein
MASRREKRRPCTPCNRCAKSFELTDWKMIGLKTQYFRRGRAMSAKRSLRGVVGYFGRKRGRKLSRPEAAPRIFLRAMEQQ